MMPSEFAYAGPHDAFPAANPDDLLWHHLSLADILEILRTAKLHFSRLDTFADPFEGTLPKAHVEALNNSGIHPAPEWRDLERARYAASCWYLSEHESDAMWRLYAKDGVAIQSTFGRLISSLPPQQPPREDVAGIYVGKVSYVDYARETLKPIVIGGAPRWNNAFIQVMHKRLSFAHENEVRALVTAMGEMVKTPTGQVRGTAIPPHGALVPVDVQTLIQEVYVSPTKPEWFRDVVQDAIGRFGLSRAVKHSSLSMKPY